MAPMSTLGPADGAFGTRLKQAREARGVSLRQIADRTKLSMVALEALERDDISRLPGGIFSRAFVRSYAAEVGLDPERTVREFIEQFPHEWVTAGSPHVRHDEEEPASDTHRRVLAIAVAVVIGLAAVAGGIMVWRAAPEPADAASPPAAPAAADTTARVARPGPDPMIVELTARGPLVLEVIVDGTAEASRDVAAGERLEFSAEREVTLTASDAGALDLWINGQPAAALGPAGERASVRIDRANVGDFLTTP